MTAVLMSLLSVTLLLNPPEEKVVGPAMPKVKKSAASSARREVTSARITSRTSDFDRQAGVIMFEGDVCVRYSKGFSMNADRLYMFISGTNELSRVVAIGSVSISNENRVGTCALATYRRQRGEIEMFGDDKRPIVRLSENDNGVRTLEGTRIRFWLDAEQMEVENTRMTAKGKGGIELL